MSENASIRMSKREEAACLSFDPFAGDETDVRLVSDKFVTVRKPHKCQHCGDGIAIGQRVRACSEINREDNTRCTFYFCSLCCEAMAKSWEDDGDAFEERSIQWRKLKARMEAGI